MTTSTARQLLALLRICNGACVQEATEMWEDVRGARGFKLLVEQEGATLWLYRKLHELGVSLKMPEGVALRASAHEQLMYGLRVDEETHAVAAIFQRAQIPFVLIKGPARRVAAGLYPYADARATSDVDLLLPEGEALNGWNTLRNNGYESTEAVAPTPQQHFHFQTLWNHRRVGVEVHTSTAPWLSPTESWERQVTGSDVIERNGMSFTIANATELLWHGMSHAFIDGALGFRLRTFLDGAAIIASRREIDWSVINGRIVGGEIRNVDTDAAVSAHLLRKWIATAGMLAGVELPEQYARAGVFALARLLHWKRMVASSRIGRAARDRLIEEATRSELGMLLTPSPEGAPMFNRTRRRAATAVARAGYLGWRAVH